MQRLDDITCICVEPNGDIPICDAVLLGNADEDDIIELLEAYEPYAIPELKAILEEGVAGSDSRDNLNSADISREGHYTLCELCMSKRRNKPIRISQT